VLTGKGMTAWMRAVTACAAPAPARRLTPAPAAPAALAAALPGALAGELVHILAAITLAPADP
jgi:hypothetical protein